ncbi:WXG100 family type VII secretion target [Actinosynnema sp. NPDC059335]|uniref:WXG100 family type VII secretion target n=1 Tax=Actinosynnema sp. NPDC059335 TaxID=3346804 RepID=UPI00366ADAE6
MTEPVGLRRADELHRINESVRRNDWVGPDTVVVPGGTSALGPAPDPVDVLSNTGIPGLLDQLQPMREAQRWFAGDPGAVTAYVEKWQRVADLAREAGDGFDTSVRRNTTDWAGEAGTLYRENAATHQDDLDTLVEAAEAIVALVTAAGDLAGSSRAHIQESVTQCVDDIVNRLPDYYNVLNSGHPVALNHVLADAAAIVAGWA